MTTDQNRTESKQISKDRQKQTAEIFTPPELVREMLSKIPKKVLEDEASTFCDPASGDGNILVVVYEEKLERGHDPIKALDSVFGVDIMKDNIASCKKRLKKLALEAANGKKERKINDILRNNIVWANSLEYDFCFEKGDNRTKTARLCKNTLDNTENKKVVTKKLTKKSTKKKLQERRKCA